MRTQARAPSDGDLYDGKGDGDSESGDVPPPPTDSKGGRPPTKSVDEVMQEMSKTKKKSKKNDKPDWQTVGDGN